MGISFIKFWDEYIYSKITKAKSMLREKKSYNLYCDMAGIYSGTDRITYFYTIDELPKTLENSFVTTLRSVIIGSTRLSFITFLEKSDIDWDSPKIKSKLAVWRRVDSELDEGDIWSFAKDQQSLDYNEWKKESLEYLVDALKRRRRKMYRMRCLVVLSGVRGVEFDKSNEAIVKAAASMQLQMTRVFGDIVKFIQTFSPFAFQIDNKVFDMCGNQSLTDELLARVNTYAQGQVGLAGCYMGTDIYSGYPTLKLFKKTAETAENFLITAETGGGKSFYVKGILLQLLANPSYIGTIMDVEGFEYSTLHDFINIEDISLFINMAEGSGAYFDPVAITMTGNEDLDKGMYALSLSFTVSLIKCLLGDLVKKGDTWTDAVINDAVQKTYSRVGVKPDDMSTWERSQELTLKDVYMCLKSLKVSSGADNTLSASHSIFGMETGTDFDLSQNDVTSLITTNAGYQAALDPCIAKLSVYFEENGSRAYFFKQRVTVDEIRNAKLVVCSFGMAGRSESSVDPTQMNLMQLYAANISHLRSIFGKLSGRFNFKVWEEFQRWGHFPDSEKTINVALTGGRKLGDLNFIITNKVKELLDNDVFGIFGNINSFAVGCISDALVREELCERLSIQQLQPELDLLYTKNQDLSSYVEGDTLDSHLRFANPYQKAFLIGLDRTVYTIARMELPDDLADSSIFKTGVDVKQAS